MSHEGDSWELKKIIIEKYTIWVKLLRRQRAIVTKNVEFGWVCPPSAARLRNGSIFILSFFNWLLYLRCKHNVFLNAFFNYNGLDRATELDQKMLQMSRNGPYSTYMVKWPKLADWLKAAKFEVSAVEALTAAFRVRIFIWGAQSSPTSREFPKLQWWRRRLKYSDYWASLLGRRIYRTKLFLHQTPPAPTA